MNSPSEVVLPPLIQHFLASLAEEVDIEKKSNMAGNSLNP
jgi:hypothetical protein